MRRNRTLLILGLILFLGLAGLGIYAIIQGDSAGPAAPATGITAPEYIVREIPLEGPAARREAELSGLGWYRDNLILLPQYPGRLSRHGDGALYALPKETILAYLDGSLTQALEPIEVPLVSGGIEDSIPGFEGFEAIAFQGERTYLTIEARRGGEMMGYLVSGQISPDLSELRLDPDSLTENPPQVNLGNQSDESLLVVEGTIVTLYEVNGVALNPSPHGSQFDAQLAPQAALPFPHIEYRVTDASRLDDQGNFWVINYFFPGDVDLRAEGDPLVVRHGQGATHAANQTVERLVELSYSPQGITITDTPPIQLELLGDKEARNWEGLVRLEGLGFLLVTDKHPDTILGFVAYP